MDRGKLYTPQHKCGGGRGWGVGVGRGVYTFTLLLKEEQCIPIQTVPT